MTDRPDGLPVILESRQLISILLNICFLPCILLCAIGPSMRQTPRLDIGYTGNPEKRFHHPGSRRGSDLCDPASVRYQLCP